MGWDSFGMPAENAAKQNDLNPKNWTEEKYKDNETSTKKLGLSIDWKEKYQLVILIIISTSKNYF